MDQGITKRRLLYSGQKMVKKLIVLIITMMVLFGVGNAYKQFKAIRSDQKLVKEMESSLEDAEKNVSKEANKEAKNPDTPEELRAHRELDWADLQVKYYDSRVAALIKTNQEIADYFQHSLLNKGDLRNMPCYQIRFSLHRLMNPSLNVLSEGTYRTSFSAINEMYKTETFYSEAKMALKEDTLSEVYLDELIDINYDPLTGLVSVKAYHPESETAKKLCYIALDSMQTTLRGIGINQEEINRLDEGARRETMEGLANRQRDLLRDMKDNQNELVLLQGQEPPKAQQQHADQKDLPSVRSFHVRSFLLYLIAGFLLGCALAVLLVALDAIVNRNVLFLEDYREEGVSAIVGWGKTRVGSDLLRFARAEDVANFLQQYYPEEDPSCVLLLSAISLAEEPAFAPFTQSLFPTDGSMILPDEWRNAKHVVLFAAENSLKRDVYEPLKASLALAHQHIDAVVMVNATVK